MKKEQHKKKVIFNQSNIPLSSSLAHLAYGDLAFKAWREKKEQEQTSVIENEK